MDDLWSGAEAICVYSRKDAIEDGEQFPLSEKFPDDCKIYKIPVFCTKRVWNLIQSSVENKEHHNDFSGVIWDICWMSIKSTNRIVFEDESGVEFTVIVTGANAQANYVQDRLPHYRLQVICAPTDFDDPAPCMLIKFPDED